MKARNRRRRKGAKISLPGGAAPIPQRSAKPKRAPAEDSRATVIATRLRHAGLPDNPEARRDALDPRRGCAAGRFTLTLPDEQGERLWRAVQHIRATTHAYRTVIGAPAPHPQSLRILLPTPEMHADASTPALDVRSEAERYTDALTAWTHLQTWLCHASAAARAAVARHVVDEIDAPVRDGAALIDALECVAEGMAGKVVQVRT